MMRLCATIGLGVLLWSSQPLRQAEPPITRVSDVRRFAARLERVWKERDWRTLSTIAAYKVTYDSSDEGSAYFDGQGAQRRTFFKQFMLYGKVEDRFEARTWKPTFREKWAPKIVNRQTNKSGFNWFNRYDGYVQIQVSTGPYYYFFLKRERGYWRLRGLYRSSA